MPAATVPCDGVHHVLSVAITGCNEGNTLRNCLIDPAAGTESGHIGNLNPQGSIEQKK